MTIARALALLASFVLIASFGIGTVSAQTEEATAEDGAPASEAPAETAPAPSVPVGANLTPPLGALPPGPQLITLPGTGHSGASSVSMAPGTLTTGNANEGRNAVRAPEAEPALVPETESAPETTEAAPETTTAPASACSDYPTWYDAQLTLESSVDPAVIGALDPDGDTIACEEVMYP
jgi:hypothetical protein